MVNENKLIPHSYDLPRLEEILIGKKVACILQPIKNMQIKSTGLSSSSTKKIKQLLNSTPQKLINNISFIPALKYDIIEPITKRKLVENIINTNLIISTDQFTFPRIGYSSKNNYIDSNTLFAEFVVLAKKKNKDSKIGFHGTPKEIENFLKTNQEALDYVLIESGVTTFAGTKAVERTINSAIAKSISPICINTNILVEGFEYSATFEAEPVRYFSLHHGMAPPNKEPSYFNPIETISIKTKSGKESVTNYWTSAQMINKYGVDYPLSKLCGCQLCAKETVRSFFENNNNTIVDKNMVHKTLFVMSRIDYWKQKSIEIKNVTKQILTLEQPIAIDSTKKSKQRKVKSNITIKAVAATFGKKE